MVKRRTVLSEDELKIVQKNRTDEEVFEEFFKDCYLRNLRPTTIKYYENEFHASKKLIQKDLVQWQPEDVEEFICRSKDLMTITSINTRLRALRCFYNFCSKKKILKRNPMKETKMLRDRQKTIETLDNNEIETLIKTIRKDRTFVSFRDEVIMLLFLDTGIRLSELAGIKLQDVQGNKVIIRLTKNLFERTVYLSEITQEQLERYIKIRGDLATDYLFVNRDNKPLNRHSIQTRFQKYGRDARIQKRVSPHTFRHTMARRMILMGIDAFSLMTLLGHSDMTITKKYVNLWGADIEAKHRKHGALKGLRL
ncbi:tyrosine-type recombinase/integrase [Neobacillus sp. 179-J 1A1 HS]|uniref:tyrosine-type recombinase/integrase n=1 Tax=Neobacillus driksii TaxID=3035913 RepID=UPI0035BBF7F9